MFMRFLKKINVQGLVKNTLSNKAHFKIMQYKIIFKIELRNKENPLSILLPISFFFFFFFYTFLHEE